MANDIEALKQRWDHGRHDRVIHARDLEDGTWVAAVPLMFHWMMIRGDWEQSLGCYFDRWCYQTEELAVKALNEFPINPPAEYEPSGWHRHPPTHRRRVNGDPAQEYIDP